jgi:hypothetical protein
MTMRNSITLYYITCQYESEYDFPGIGSIFAPTIELISDDKLHKETAGPACVAAAGVRKGQIVPSRPEWKEVAVPLVTGVEGYPFLPVFIEVNI